MMGASLQGLGAFVAAAALVIMVPGPATLFVAGQAQVAAWRAVRSTFGIVLGDIVLIALSALGLSTLLREVPSLARAIEVSGAAYLGWLGVSLWRTAHQVHLAQTPITSGGFLQGLALTLTNPKPVLFFGAFFPLFIDRASGDWAGGFLVLGAVFELLNLSYFAALIWLVARVRSTSQPQRAAARFQRFSGAGLVLCAVAILAKTW